jgi:hypothetical protein
MLSAAPNQPCATSMLLLNSLTPFPVAPPSVLLLIWCDAALLLLLYLHTRPYQGCSQCPGHMINCCTEDMPTLPTCIIPLPVLLKVLLCPVLLPFHRLPPCTCPSSTSTPPPPPPTPHTHIPTCSAVGAAALLIPFTSTAEGSRPMAYMGVATRHLGG